MSIVKLSSDDTVKNVIGSSRANLESSIHEWRKCTGKENGKCSILGCSKPSTTGSHVKLGYLNKKSYYWYIIPTCHIHNKGSSNERFNVKKNVLAVREERIHIEDHLNSLLQNIKERKF